MYWKIYFTVVNVDDAVSTRVQAILNQSIVLRQVGSVQCATQHPIDQKLPSHGKAEDVHAVILHEMRHLPWAVWPIEGWQRWIWSVVSSNYAGAIRAAAKVKSSDVDSGKLRQACRGSCWRC